MTGRLAEFAEITGGRHQPAAEMILPDAIDDHARRQRMVRTRQPIGEGRTPAGGGETNRRRDYRGTVVENGQKTRRNGWPGGLLGNVGRRRFGADIPDRQRRWQRLWLEKVILP